MNRDIAILVGSLHKESFNRKMAHALIESAAAMSVNVGNSDDGLKWSYRHHYRHRSWQ